LVAIFAAAYALDVPEEHIAAVDDLLILVQEEKMRAPQVDDMNQEQFALLMNKIIMRASKMRVVMNKLGISDTDSVQSVEEHFLKLGKEHADLGEGMTNEEELRVHGLKARSCVKHAMGCSSVAAECHGLPSDCKGVVETCSRAGAACGIRGLGESAHTKKKKKKKSSKAKHDSKSKSAPAKPPKAAKATKASKTAAPKPEPKEEEELLEVDEAKDEEKEQPVADDEKESEKSELDSSEDALEQLAELDTSEDI